jgi:hypothetical protein
MQAGKSPEKEARGWRGVLGIEQKNSSSGLRRFWKQQPDCPWRDRLVGPRRGIVSIASGVSRREAHSAMLTLAGRSEWKSRIMTGRLAESG